METQENLNSETENQQPTSVEIIPTNPIQEFINSILNNEMVKEVLMTWVQQDEKVKKIESEDKSRFIEFLNKIDWRQKLYNILFIIASSIGIWGLKTSDVIGKETAQTLVTIIFSIGFVNGISSFFNSRKED